MKKFHAADIVDIDLVYEYHNESFPVELDGKHRGGESELTNGSLLLCVKDT